jgi:uncharacterized protein (TIGR02145 family)
MRSREIGWSSEAVQLWKWSIQNRKVYRPPTTTTTTTAIPLLNVKYGYLYNWYAATDIKGIGTSEWHLPSSAEWIVLREFLRDDDIMADPSTYVGGILKEIGNTYWNTPSEYTSTNAVGFNARGAGYRYIGDFADNKITLTYQQSTLAGSTVMWYFDAMIACSSFGIEADRGQSIRLIKNNSDLSNGDEGIYIGNDGKVYRTICIGTQEWLADNLCETKYRDGTPIPEVTNNTTWAGLITGARCSYDNDESNAFTI